MSNTTTAADTILVEVDARDAACATIVLTAGAVRGLPVGGPAEAFADALATGPEGGPYTVEMDAPGAAVLAECLAPYGHSKSVQILCAKFMDAIEQQKLG